MTPLLHAAMAASNWRVLLDAGASVNRADANDITPLLMAITNDHMALARLLIEHGADVNAADFWGRTPLFSAVEMRNRDYTRGNEHGIDRAAALEMITLLLDRGANPNARTKEIPPIRRWVTSLGDLTWINMIGQTPFIRASMSGDITTMRLLLARGADPKITTEGARRRWSPLPAETSLCSSRSSNPGNHRCRGKAVPRARPGRECRE